MITFVSQIVNEYNKAKQNDPVKHCEIYNTIGCAHVDGMLCDYPNCSMLKKEKQDGK